MNMTFLMVFILVFLCIWIYSVYTGLIQKRNKVQEAFSSIDVQLKKRYDLIPNILTIAKKYIEHEKGLLEEITKLRNQALKLAGKMENIDKKIELDVEISKKMGQIMVTVENYPEIKADQPMMTAMKTYNEVEEHIAAARRFYNAAALELKNTVEIFPGSIVASIMNIQAVEFFNVDEKERQVINASDYLK